MEKTSIEDEEFEKEKREMDKIKLKDIADYDERHKAMAAHERFYKKYKRRLTLEYLHRASFAKNCTDTPSSAGPLLDLIEQDVFFMMGPTPDENRIRYSTGKNWKEGMDDKLKKAARFLEEKPGGIMNELSGNIMSDLEWCIRFADGKHPDFFLFVSMRKCPDILSALAFAQRNIHDEVTYIVGIEQRR